MLAGRHPEAGSFHFVEDKLSTLEKVSGYGRLTRMAVYKDVPNVAVACSSAAWCGA